MKRLTFLLMLLAQTAFADGLYLPNLKANATGTLQSGHNSMDVNIASGTITVNVASNGLTGAAVPLSADYIGGNKAGNITGLLIGQQTMANSLACVLPSDQSAIPVTQSGTWPVTQSGTWNINNVSGTVSLPTGAATVAKQPALGTAGTASSDVITVQGIASMTALKVDASATTQPVSGTVTANQGGAWTVAQGTANATPWNENISQYGGTSTSLGQKSMSASIPVTIASDQVAPKTYQNTAGSFVLNSSLTTVVTETAPATAVGFILEAKDSNAANIRWALGATATTSSGMQLQPGRDTGFVPVAADISIVAESGTLEYQLSWVKQ